MSELAPMVNEHPVALVRLDPDRFAALAFLPLPNIDAGLDERAYTLRPDPAPGLAWLGAATRARLDAANASALVPRLAAREVS